KQQHPAGREEGHGAHAAWQAAFCRDGGRQLAAAGASARQKKHSSGPLPARRVAGEAAFYNARMFVHLRLHTEFSVVDGTNRIDEVVASAAADGQGALAITDLSNLFGAVKFYKAARSKGLKPLLGAELMLAGPDGATPSRIV